MRGDYLFVIVISLFVLLVTLLGGKLSRRMGWLFIAGYIAYIGFRLVTLTPVEAA